MNRLRPFLPLCAAFVAAWLAGFPSVAARADDSDSGPAPYAKFIDDAQVQFGLLNIIRKNGKVYIEIAASQLGKDFVQTAEQTNGLGGYNSIPGGINSYARIIRFTRSDDKIVVTWPNTYFIAPGNEAAQRAIERTVANSTVAVAPIAAENKTTASVVFDASFLLTDIYDLKDQLKQITGPDNPDQAYHLDSDRTLFGPSKAFPYNVIINADQTWANENPKVVDNVPDPRSIQFRVAYNIARPPNDGDYMPRLADDRVGFFDAAYINFARDPADSRIVRYVVRWNMQPSDPTKPMSQAKHPLVYYLSNNIPTQYRDAVRRGILDWNRAFERIGISDAIQVKDQPNDPNWDADDIRYNTVVWLTESNSGGYAAENPVFDPRTGQIFRTNVVIDADIMAYSNQAFIYQVDPTVFGRGTSLVARERHYAEMRQQQAGFGKVALDIMGRPLSGQGLAQFNDQLMESFIVHEAGHGLGLQHNFIGSIAYTARELQSKDFTAAHGVATSVMEYAGLNLWPRGYGQGTYWQTVLGPYDYHAIHWGYAPVHNARTPQDEVPTLTRWASNWADPLYRFASDEDVDYPSAHAIDPRVAQFDFTNDPLAWDETQLKLVHDLMSTIDKRWPKPGHSYDDERTAFGFVFGQWQLAATQPEHYIGGEYLSRSHAGDPKASPPLVSVPRAREQRAFGILDKYVFSDRAWQFSPKTLNRLVYSEWESLQGGSWAYQQQPRHDLPVAEMAETAQRRQLARMFQPLMLERLNDLSLKSKPGVTMSLTDLFDWTQASVYGDLRDPKLTGIGEVHRSLQQWYARMLARLWLTPTPDTPFDAQSLARAELKSLRQDTKVALSRPHLDRLTRAHLESLQDVVSRPLDARQLFPVKQ
ncbi:MAG: zinc-dependent metalloprotease [Candidatus Eremiobacter antarcticus]|nr:zinc-dependent metalloprotease [Candidatus Eremiobacteraeota bacterium]